MEFEIQRLHPKCVYYVFSTNHQEPSLCFDQPGRLIPFESYRVYGQKTCTLKVRDAYLRIVKAFITSKIGFIEVKCELSKSLNQLLISLQNAEVFGEKRKQFVLKGFRIIEVRISEVRLQRGNLKPRQTTCEVRLKRYKYVQSLLGQTSIFSIFSSYSIIYPEPCSIQYSLLQTSRPRPKRAGQARSVLYFYAATELIHS